MTTKPHVPAGRKAAHVPVKKEQQLTAEHVHKHVRGHLDQMKAEPLQAIVHAQAAEELLARAQKENLLGPDEDAALQGEMRSLMAAKGWKLRTGRR